MNILSRLLTLVVTGNTRRLYRSGKCLEFFPFWGLKFQIDQKYTTAFFEQDATSTEETKTKNISDPSLCTWRCFLEDPGMINWHSVTKLLSIECECKKFGHWSNLLILESEKIARNPKEVRNYKKTVKLTKRCSSGRCCDIKFYIYVKRSNCMLRSCC